MKASTRAKTARLEARISAEQKALIERAAAYERRSVSDFVVQAVQREAKNLPAREFYARYGFKSVLRTPSRMFLSMKAIAID